MSYVEVSHRVKRRKLDDLPSCDRLEELFFQNARCKPNNIAVRWFSEKKCLSLTYNQTLQYVEKLCEELDSITTESGDAIGVYAEHSVELVISILSILKSGCVYVPLDISFPDNRKEVLLELANVRVIIVPKHIFDLDHHKLFLKSVSESRSICLYVVEASTSGFHIEKNFSPLRTTTSIDSMLKRRQIAYCAFTSGSTGNPKTVWVPHSCVVPNLLALGHILEVGESDCMPLIAPISFDPSIIDIFLPLSHGASLNILSPTITSIPSLLFSKLVNEVKPTIIQCTPTFIRTFNTSQMADLLSIPMRCVLLGGEEFPARYELASWIGDNYNPNLKFFNLYGITEVSVWATIEEIPVESLASKNANLNAPVSIGRPLVETELLLVDCNSNEPLCLIPPNEDPTLLRVTLENSNVINNFGIDTEERIHELVEAWSTTKLIEEARLFIGGATRTCYIDCETTPCRWRDSGDRIRFVEGELFYLGREDGSYKVYGKRFHIEEIRQALLASRLVHQVAVIVRPSARHDKALIVAFVQPIRAIKDPSEFTLSLRNYCIKHLPQHMVPDEIFIVSGPLPMTRHGKVDLRALEKLTRVETIDKGPVEMVPVSVELLLEVVKEALVHKSELKVDVDSYFVSLGATSIDVFRCVELIFNRLRLDDRIQSGIAAKELRSELRQLLLHEQILSFCKKACDLINEMESRKPQYREIDQLFEIGHEFATKPDAITRTITRCNRTRTISNSSTSIAPLELGLDDISSIRQLWHIFLGKCVDASPLLLETANGRLYAVFCSHSGLVACIDVFAGSFAWKRELNDRFEASPELSSDNQTVIIGSYGGLLYGLQVSTGNLLWSQHLSHFPIKAAVCSDTNSNIVWVGCNGGTLYVFDTKSLKILTFYQNNAPLYASPVMAHTTRKVIVACENGEVVCYQADTPYQMLWTCSLNAPIFSTPLVVENHDLVICAAVNHHVVGLCLSTGEPIWRFSTSGPIFSSPCLATPTTVAFGCHDDHAYCLSLKDGQLVWKTDLQAKVFSSPFSVTTKQSKSAIIVACVDGRVFILDALTGEHREFAAALGHIYSSPCVSAQGFILIGSRDDCGYCFKIT